jgi:type IV pilus biogenesis protein CpaD/CtpE
MRKRRRCGKNPVSPALLIVFCVSIAATVSGCASTEPIATAAQLCKDWRVLRPSKQDKLTQGTAEEMEASNKSRSVYGCHPQRNEASG